MPLPRMLLLAGTFLLALAASADCGCPLAARSRNLLVAVTDRGGAGLVACGWEEARTAASVTASELEIFRCGATKPLLEFRGLQTVELRTSGAVLHVRETARWPFGRDWDWTDVPLWEWSLTPAIGPVPEKRVLAQTPRASGPEIRAFVAAYKSWLRAPRATRTYENAEELVARLFTAAVAGDAEAIELFLRMREDAGLDGAAAETYSAAIDIYQVWREAGRL